MPMYRVSHFVTRFALWLLAGVALGTLWANLSPETYADVIDFRLMDGLVGYVNPGLATRTLTVAYLIGEVLMPFFFLLVGKELWEAIVLEHGALRGRRAGAPVSAAVLGALVPVVLFLLLAPHVQTYSVPASSAWMVPMSSDVILSYAVGLMVFGRGHPALRFLLMLAILDDIGGLLATGFAFPEGGLHPLWLLMPLGAGLGAFVLFNWLPRRLDRGRQLRPASTFMRRRLGIWPYALAGVISWYGVQQSGLSPALGLLPILPAIPHADRAFGIFSEAEEMLADTLNRIAHLLVHPVGAILFLFGLSHGGAQFWGLGGLTWAIAAALVIGKPLGVVCGAMIGARLSRGGLPEGMDAGDLGLAGLIAAVGLTVPLIAIATALPEGADQQAARLGLYAGGLLAAGLLAMARLTGTARRTG